MSTPDMGTAATGILVRLLRPGVGAETYQLPLGATLADLLDAAGEVIVGRAVLVDGGSPEEALVLPDGAVVTIAPRPRNAAGSTPKARPQLRVRDEEAYREFLASLEDVRRQGCESAQSP